MGDSHLQPYHAITDDTMVGFIGAGKMAQALFKGIIGSATMKAEKIIASNCNQELLKQITPKEVIKTTDNTEVAKNADVIVISVKPYKVAEVLREITPHVTNRHLIISIAGGITIKTMEENLPPKTRIVRVMPNTPALVGCGASVYACGQHVLDGDKLIVEKLFSGVGICEQGTEKLIDAVTGLSGSGPAYVYIAIEALADGGVKMGLPRDLSLKLAAQTVMGAGKMCAETGQHPAQLKDDVCSPAGTTIAGVHQLEKSGFRSALINAVEAATNRARELGS